LSRLNIFGKDLRASGDPCFKPSILRSELSARTALSHLEEFASEHQHRRIFVLQRHPSSPPARDNLSRGWNADWLGLCSFHGFERGPTACCPPANQQT
jgi:hypothetical protein